MKQSNKENGIKKKNPQLWISIIEAKELHSNPPNNPYCKIVVGKNIYRTHVMKNTLNPRWDENFFVDNYDINEKHMLYIYVQKKTSLGKSHIYGMITVDVAKLQGGETIKEWCPLQNKNGKSAESGQLYVVIKLEDLENTANENQAENTENNIVTPSETITTQTNNTPNTVSTKPPRSESPTKELEDTQDSEKNQIEKSKEDSVDQKDLITANESEEEDQEISEFAANIISNLQREISELKLKLNDHEKRKSKRIKTKMTEFFKSSKEKSTTTGLNNTNNQNTSTPTTTNANNTNKPPQKPSKQNTETQAPEKANINPPVTEEEEKMYLSKNEWQLHNFFNSTEEERSIILQETFDATPVEIFKFIFSDQTNFFYEYHKCREDWNIKIGKWEDHELFEKKREIEFTAPLAFKIGPSKTHNWETQRYHLTKDRFLLAIYSRAPEIMFGKYFQVEALWEYILIGERKTQLTIKFACPFSDYTVLKGTITKNAIKTYTDSHKMFIEMSKNEITNCLAQYDLNRGPNTGGIERPLESGSNEAPSSTSVVGEQQPSSVQQPKPFQYQKPIPSVDSGRGAEKKSEWVTDSNFKLIYYSNILVWIFIFFILFFHKSK